MPKRPASDVGCNSTPLDLGKLTVTSAVMTGAIIQKRGPGVRGRGPDKEGIRTEGEMERENGVSACLPFAQSSVLFSAGPRSLTPSPQLVVCSSSDGCN